jgi:hypothetical protein
MSELKITTRDANQVHTYEHDDALRAKRVIIVGGEMPEFKMPEINFSDIKFPEQKIQIIEVPVIVEKEKIVYVDKPIIVEKIVYERIEIPVVVKETIYEKVESTQSNTSIPSIVEVEKVVFVPQIQVEYKEFPVWIRVCLVTQILVSLIMLLKIAFK